MSAIKCPKCGNDTWDETKSKYYKPGESPIAKCKDKNCGGKVYAEKGQGAAPAAKQEPKPIVPLADLTAEYGKLLRTVARNLNEIAPELNDKLKPTFADAQAAAATIYIQFRKQG